ncbi:predicted protein [Pyrenophora tritici-repentis Pt-1C-BFP]|uniref:Uncharacterized protein n=1 Tax=Pyrenophora tritici-repentis (strain Pt-1C-BFP) TaxID=426418 RepID=B2W0X0_PYRTR|nr:uncharacterized protein PTRG_04105 [Pyrenophora tritici-repentis Pt-1C-BFP]EDU46943.1 predicted protein [Pyrenophora tritici-repentis Pt-1C-BFP]
MSETRVMHLNGGFLLGIATWVFWGPLPGESRTSRDAGKASRRFRHSYPTCAQGV